MIFGILYAYVLPLILSLGIIKWQYKEIKNIGAEDIAIFLAIFPVLNMILVFSVSMMIIIYQLILLLKKYYFEGDNNED